VLNAVRNLWRFLAAGPLARGSAWSFVGSIGTRLLALIAMIFIARITGKKAFGELGILQSTLGLAGLLAGSSLGAAATRFVARHRSRDTSRLGSTIGMLNMIGAISILSTTLIILCSSPWIAARILNAPELGISLNLGCILMGCNVLRGIQSGCLAGFERFDINAKSNLVEGVISLLASVILARFLGLNGAIIGFSIGAIASWIWGGVKSRDVYKNFDIKIRYRDCLKEWRLVISYSVPALIASVIATPVTWYCQTQVAVQYSGYEQVGLFNAAYQWHGPMIFLPMILMSTSIPMLVQMWESEKVDEFRKAAYQIILLALAVSIPPALLVCAMSPWVMSLYGIEFSEGWPILIMVVLAAPFHAITNISVGALYGMNRPWRVVFVNILWAAVMAVVSLTTIPRFGIVGFTLGFFVAYFVQAIIAVRSAFPKRILNQDF